MGLPVYHFLEVGNLAWFSTMTHILTLTVMRDTVRMNQALRILRIISMGILVVLLICVMAPIGCLVSPLSADGLYPITPEFPTWCLYRPSVQWESSLMGLTDDPVLGPVERVQSFTQPLDITYPMPS
jgi:predicted PurR-regulated permease PerM